MGLMYSRKQFNEKKKFMFPIFFQSLMGPIKFYVTFLVGPPNCTSTLMGFLKKTYKGFNTKLATCVQ